VAQVPVAAGEAPRYVVVGGDFDYVNNKLLEQERVGGGGFYLLEQSTQSGFSVLASLDIPASKVLVRGHYAYLAAGEGGLVIVDIRLPASPKVVARVTGFDHVYDVSI